MGRPGAGGGSLHKSSGSMHRVSGSSGSMHRVGGVSSRPAMKSTISRPKQSVNVSRPVSRPAVDVSRPAVNVSKHKPAIRNNSRPSMNNDRAMFGGYGNVDGRSEERRIQERIEQEAREREIRERDERIRREREREERIRREREREKVIVVPTPVMPPRFYHSEPVQQTVVHNTYVNNYSDYDNDEDARDTYVKRDSDSNRSGSGMIAPVHNDYNDKEETSRNKHKVLIAMSAIMVVIAIIIAVVSNNNKSQRTSLNRVKLDTGLAYMNDCVNDELGWVNENKVSKGLKQFYNDTGAQPYIWLRAYDGTDYNDDEEMDIALDYFDNVVSRQDAVMLVYFEESDPNEVGNMALIHGSLSGAIMDAEAEDIFWNNLDAAWETYSEDETDEMFIHIFESTGNAIMYHPTSGWDVLNGIVILLSIMGVAGAIIIAVREVNRRNKEKAEETERILSSSLEEIAGEKKDDLLEKYK